MHLEYCSEPRCYFKEFQSEHNRQDYIVLPSYSSIGINQEVILSCAADAKNLKPLTYLCGSDGHFEPPPSEKLCEPTEGCTLPTLLVPLKFSLYSSNNFFLFVDIGLFIKSSHPTFMHHLSVLEGSTFLKAKSEK